MASALSAYSAELEKYLLDVDQLAVRNLIDKLLKECQPLDIIENLITPVLQKIGAGWEKGDLALSQVYMSGRLCEEILPDLLPKAGSVPKNNLKIAIAVLEDYHTLGKRIVYTYLRACGYNVIDYGHGINAGDLARKVIEDNIQILMISTLMLRAALQVKAVKEILDKSECKTKIIVGGAPFLLDDQLWRMVSADAMGRTASEAIETIESLAEDIS